MKIEILKQEVRDELLQNILPFWMKAADLEHGGFVGQITGTGVKVYDSPKGGVLNARILWAFAAAYRVLKDPLLSAYADRAKNYLLNYFNDKKNGGIYWMLDAKGNPIDSKKQIYALGFAIYGLSEYARATGDEEALNAAISLFNDIEEHSFDKIKNGYFEAFAVDWSLLDDVRLSEKDANESKTMNTHLHILEPYTNLYRAWKSPLLKLRIENLLELFLTKFLDSSSFHLKLFFNDDWESKSDNVSYGHDIEASWLMHEAAQVIGNAELLARVESVVAAMADASKEGIRIQPDGSMAYEFEPGIGHTDTDRHWWVQAETVVGYLNAYRLTGDESYRDIALNCWEYIKNHIIDKNGGEWFWSAAANGKVNTADDKLGVWKCPYHNARMCLEVMEREF